MCSLKLIILLCFVMFVASIKEKKMCKKISKINKRLSSITKAIESLKDTCDNNGNNVNLTLPIGIELGTIVFRDDFDGATLDTRYWNYDVSMYGGYNWEFQVYTNDPLNVFLKDGKLYLKPTLTADKFGEAFLTNGIMDVPKIWGYCTNNDRFGCYRDSKYGILPPIMSGKINSKKTITYGRIDLRAKIPKGDWIWPAIWLLPKNSHRSPYYPPAYGEWPRSGEIDMMESRGNLKAEESGNDHGVGEIGSTLHWGPDAAQDRWTWTHGVKDDPALGWSSDFHLYSLDWNANRIICSVDKVPVLTVPTPTDSFWDWGNFTGLNPWASGGKNAPFDQPFYLSLNVAIGGINKYFPDDWSYNTPKPWKNTSPTANADFWSKRDDWLPTWNGDDVAMQIDYVQMTQY